MTLTVVSQLGLAGYSLGLALQLYEHIVPMRFDRG